MPVMPRVQKAEGKKGTKIAYKILGVPANLKPEKLSETQKKIKRRLIFEETARVK